MAETVNLQKSYAAVNTTLAKLFDESGVRRSFTIPYVEGHAMADHINAVSQVAAQQGGFTQNFITSGHHATGKGYGSADGETTGHPSEKLRQTTIPKDDPNAKAAIAAAQKIITQMRFLLGDDEQTVQTAQGQLNLVKPTDAAGMSLFDFGVLIINMLHKPIQAVARAHSGTKPGGHAVHLRGPVKESPQVAQESTPAAPGGAEGESQAPTGGQAAPAAPEAQEAPAAPAAPEQAQA